MSLSLGRHPKHSSRQKKSRGKGEREEGRGEEGRGGKRKGGRQGGKGRVRRSRERCVWFWGGGGMGPQEKVSVGVSLTNHDTPLSLEGWTSEGQRCPPPPPRGVCSPGRSRPPLADSPRPMTGYAQRSRNPEGRWLPLWSQGAPEGNSRAEAGGARAATVSLIEASGSRLVPHPWRGQNVRR